MLLPIRKLCHRLRVVVAALCWSSVAAAAIPLIGSNPSAGVEIIPVDNALRDTIGAQLKAYAQAHRDAPLGDQRRVRAELLIIRKQLRAEGYYQARVSQRSASLYRVVPGQRVTIDSLAINPEVLAGEAWPALNLQVDQPLRAAAVLAARDQLLTYARRRCYPRVIVEYRVNIRESTQTADVVFTVLPGPHTELERVEISGLKTVNEQFLRNRMALNPGQCLRRNDLDRARLALLQTGLVGSASYEIEWPEPIPADTTLRLPVRFSVTERKSQSVKASVGFTTDAKEGASLGWEHRNLFGDAEKLEIEGGIDSISHSALARLTLPQFYHPRQELQIIADIDTEEPDAYTSRSKELAAILSRDWAAGLRASAGLAFTESRVEEGGDGDTFALVSIPLALSLDRRDNPVDARRGWYTSLAVRPFTDISQEDLQFTQTVLSARGYISAPDWRWQPTLALRATAGGISGAEVEDIPADQRFYVGGGGSVRGYPYQSVGELTDGEADGGKSFAEVSLEARLHTANNWGLVLFADGGYAYPDEVPKPGEEFLWGAGLGLRYFTRFAPVRVDIAAPLNRRDDIDNDFQLYISFGQAF